MSCRSSTSRVVRVCWAAKTPFCQRSSASLPFGIRRKTLFPSPSPQAPSRYIVFVINNIRRLLSRNEPNLPGPSKNILDNTCEAILNFRYCNGNAAGSDTQLTMRDPQTIGPKQDHDCKARRQTKTRSNPLSANCWPEAGANIQQSTSPHKRNRTRTVRKMKCQRTQFRKC